MDARQEKNCFIVVIIVLNIMIVIIVIVIMVVIIVLMILMITIATIDIKVCPGSLTSSSSTTAEQRERLLYALICKSQRFLLFSLPFINRYLWSWVGCHHHRNHL